MIYLSVSIVLLATLPLGQCRVKRQEPMPIEELATGIKTLLADLNNLLSKTHIINPDTATVIIEQIKITGQNLDKMKTEIMKKYNLEKLDKDAQGHIKVLQETLISTADKLQNIAEMMRTGKHGKDDIINSIGKLIKGAAKTFEKVSGGVKESVDKGVVKVSEVAKSLYHSFLKTGQDVYSVLHQAVEKQD